MFRDKQKAVGADAVKMMNIIRWLGNPNNNTTKFHLPEVNFSATNYYEFSNFLGKIRLTFMYQSKF